MSVHITPEELKSRMAADLDAPAEAHLPEGSLARSRYRRGLAHVSVPHAPRDADRAECSTYGLSPEQWSEEVEAARIALRHDMKLDALREGAGRV